MEEIILRMIAATIIGVGGILLAMKVADVGVKHMRKNIINTDSLNKATTSKPITI